MTETQQAEVGGNPAARTYEGTPALNAALAVVQQSLPRIRKAETGQVSGETKDGRRYSYEYSYADLAAVSAELLPLLGKNGLAFTAWPMVADGKLVLRYSLLHESGQERIGDWPLKGGSPQQMGSEITYARRYCLCAVTGVAPDDDDDAAAAEGAKAQQRADQEAEIDRELQHAVDSVRGAWANQYGEFNQDQAAEMFKTWSKGGSLKNAPAGQLRAFAGYLHSLPAADAGSTPDPDTEPAPPADDQTVREVKADRPLSRKDNAHMFVLFEKLGMQEDRQAQLDYLRRTLGRQIDSRSQVRAADWAQLRGALEADVQMVQQSGMAMTQPGDS